MRYFKDDNAVAYDYLDHMLVNYSRVGAKTIRVNTAGYVNLECVSIEDSLKRIADFVVISRDYNKKTGYTETVYKHS